MCDDLGINFQLKKFDKNIDESQLKNEIELINRDNNIDSCIIQLPLPNHINQNIILNTLNPKKDADGFTFYNLGQLIKYNKEDNIIKPATVLGIVELIKYYNIETKGKNIVIIGKSVIVGTPLALVLSNEETYSGTVTLCDKNTENLENICENADILIVSTGKHHLINDQFNLKKDVTIFDVGINKIKDESKKSGYKTEGDVDFNYFKDKCKYITPVPGGVGPMTVICLIKNIINLKNNLNNNN
jgi:methylenetetrahydrofolate dehydrogenase (NADP+)/methenyltetrahydrofolate cyclohydrolase